MLVLGVGAASRRPGPAGGVADRRRGRARRVNLLLAPPLYIQPTRDAIGELADRMADYARELAGTVRGEWSRAAADHALNRARELGAEVDRADAGLARTEQSSRLNPRGRLAREAQPQLRTALTALEHAQISLRNLARALLDRTYYLAEDAADLAYDPPAKQALAEALLALADAVHAVAPGTFGTDPQAREHVESTLAVLGERRDSLAHHVADRPTRGRPRRGSSTVPCSRPSTGSGSRSPPRPACRTVPGATTADRTRAHDDVGRRGGWDAGPLVAARPAAGALLTPAAVGTAPAAGTADHDQASGLDRDLLVLPACSPPRRSPPAAGPTSPQHAPARPPAAGPSSRPQPAAWPAASPLLSGQPSAEPPPAQPAASPLLSGQPSAEPPLLRSLLLGRRLLGGLLLSRLLRSLLLGRRLLGGLLLSRLLRSLLLGRRLLGGLLRSRLLRSLLLGRRLLGGLLLSRLLRSLLLGRRLLGGLLLSRLLPARSLAAASCAAASFFCSAASWAAFLAAAWSVASCAAFSAAAWSAASCAALSAAAWSAASCAAFSAAAWSVASSAPPSRPPPGPPPPARPYRPRPGPPPLGRPSRPPPGP